MNFWVKRVKRNVVKCIFLYKECFFIEKFKIFILNLWLNLFFKNIVVVGVGFADGFGYGDNIKVVVIRLGLMEMIKFCEVFYLGNVYRKIYA